ncbi:hypothetical protein MPSEU_000355100 [Mayamaea pseudoterrestris]|nr:hypothetical protein MPSEU_000355100 [Mayamaea pseudoterrestris]
MGVPKFYRWISERYPKINQLISDNALLPEIDHLYLDLNGIIHGCTHPSDRDVSDILSEREMMLGIMNYLDRLVTQIAKPKVSVYMAIDGVAPRAKLNQQRSRRFRSAKDMAEATKDLPKDAKGNVAQVFDSNCITPGTEFLDKVSKVIQYFIRKKIKEDVLWRNLTVIFSGHDVPGEGEHKIMQHIREMRSQPSYQPNTRHCIYGQDADLIMLGLVTHEPHFVILREVVDFNSFARQTNTLKAVKKFTKQSDFQLLHLSVLREYLEMEFCYKQPEYDLERCIDDFVFMTFLVGNDFLPHMPTLDIGDGAFDLLFDLYREQRQTWNGEYLTSSGKISDAVRLENFLAAIGEAESDILADREDKDAAMRKKRRRFDKRSGTPSEAELKHQEMSKQTDFMTMIDDMMARADLCDDDFVSGWMPSEEGDGKDFKGRYYYEKLKLTPLDKDAHWHLRKSYMEGLIWCLAYYYEGCISWGWFYPYHYGPMLSDLHGLPKMFSEISFDQGAPLTPFMQLMGCLPPASGILVPPLYRGLMISPDSPIISFYPTDFEVDMNGKNNPWEGVNLLPFIDIQLLKDTIAAFCPDDKLSPDERRRNALGSVFCYRYDTSCNETIPAPISNIGISDIVGCLSSAEIINNPLSRGVPFKPELLSGTILPYPGFPTLNVLPIASVDLVRVGLNCFGFASKYPNMILTLHQLPELPPLEVLAQSVIGRSVFTNWPMMHESRVVALTNEEKEIRLVKGQHKVRKFNDQEVDRWLAESEAMVQTYHLGNGTPGSGGLVMGDVKVRIKVLPLQGMKTNATNGSTKKMFGRQEADIPLQLALLHAPAPDPRFIERGPMSLAERFPAESSVVLTRGKYRGCTGVVAGVADDRNVGVKVQILPAESPFGLAIARSVQESYISSADAAKTLRIDGRVFGKITGRLQFEQDKYDLGLNLKGSNGTCVVGYTRKKVLPSNGDKKLNKWREGDSLIVIGSSGPDTDDGSDERIIWEYTPKAIRLIESYRQAFPQLFAALKKIPDEKKYDATKVFGPNGQAFLPAIRTWLDNHETAKIPRTPVSTESMSYDAIAAVQKAADVRSLALWKAGYPKESLIKIPGNALYCEGSTGATDVLLASDLNNNDAPRLGDRIVNLCADGVPFGARGTVVAIHEAATTGSVEVVMDDEFVGGNTLQGACSNFRGRLCRWAHLLKVEPDHADRLVDKLVPKGSGQAAVKKILSSMESEIDQPKAVSARPNTVAKTAVPKVNAKAVVPDKSMPAAAPTPVFSGPDRAQSTGRGKQGAWKEARGPPKAGAGFKGKRGGGGATGIARWTSLMQSRKVDAQLKSVLGVGSDPKHTQLSSDTNDASAALKAVLGVSTSNQAHGPAPAASNTPTAAEKLLQLMANKQQAGHGLGHINPMPARGMSSAFNFTYVAEGEEAKSSYHPVPMHPGYPPMHGYPMAMPPMQMQQPYGMPPSFLHPGQMPPFNAPFGAPVASGLSTEQFPPLGTQHETATPIIATSMGSESKTAAGSQAMPFNMIPSVMTGKP